MKKFFGLCLLALMTGCTPVIDELPSFSASENAPAPVVLSGERILKILGEPTLKRRENPAEVWIYAQEKCVLFIYMNDAESATSRVTHMDIGNPSRKGVQKESRACLQLASRLLP